MLVEQEDVGDARSSLQTVLAAHTDVVKLRFKESALEAASASPTLAKRALLELVVIEAAEALRLAEIDAVKTSGTYAFERWSIRTRCLGGGGSWVGCLTSPPDFDIVPFGCRLLSQTDLGVFVAESTPEPRRLTGSRGFDARAVAQKVFLRRAVLCFPLRLIHDGTDNGRVLPPEIYRQRSQLRAVLEAWRRAHC